MTEKEWVALVIERLAPGLAEHDSTLVLEQGKRLTYAEEVTAYDGQEAVGRRATSYQTDLLVSEKLENDSWIPRLVIEAKINSVTTHDAITYSQKAVAHKAVHPYLRYGIILGYRKDFHLPARLVRHGTYFDFMQSWVDFEPTPRELDTLLNLVLAEVNASRALGEILYRNLSPNHKRYSVLHRPLMLEKPRGVEERTNSSPVDIQ